MPDGELIFHKWNNWLPTGSVMPSSNITHQIIILCVIYIKILLGSVLDLIYLSSFPVYFSCLWHFTIGWKDGVKTQF